MGQSFKRRGKPNAGSARAAADQTSAEAVAPVHQEVVDRQGDLGNDAIQELLGKKDAPEQATPASTSATDLTLPDQLRAHLLSDIEHLYLAASVYGETFATHAKEPTEEMYALSSCGFNMVDYVRDHPLDQNVFGAPANNMMMATENRSFFEFYGLDRYRDFWYAVKFGTPFKNEADLHTAKLIIEASKHIMEQNNPLPKDYVVFSEGSESPLPDHTDPGSRIQYGRFYFWSFAPQKTKQVEEEGGEEATTGPGPMMSLDSVDPMA